MILTTNKSTTLHCQQVYSSNSRSTFPLLNTRHEGLSLQSAIQVRTKRYPDVTFLLAWILLDHSLPSQFPISIHNTDTAPCQDEATSDTAAPIHGSGIRQINIVRGKSSMHDPKHRHVKDEAGTTSQLSIHANVVPIPIAQHISYFMPSTTPALRMTSRRSKQEQ